jgi:lipopolysaccharide transport system ATP-binding protein
MSSAAVLVQNLGKCYHVYDSHLDRLRQSLVGGKSKRYAEFWALRDINFDIEKGETVGVVGANGSGKSTLLQLLFGVLTPTTGTARVEGKVGGLLELGAGFNPEETGRQNVMINASILGILPADLPGLFEKIAAFADIGDFIDRPVKTYSSGMGVRLGFALQISVPSDVLIIDEALAVGDELFQRKCYGALEKFRDDGGTVLFVSHSAASVKQMCRRALFLDHGRLIQQGQCRTVIDHYQKFLYMREPEKTQFREHLMSTGPVPLDADAAEGWEPDPEADVADTAAASADFEPGLTTQTAQWYQPLGATITNPRIETRDGAVVNVLDPMTRYVYRYDVEFTQDARNVFFGWLVKTTSGLELGGGTQDPEVPEAGAVSAGTRFEVAFEFSVPLHPRVYFLNCGVSGSVEGYDGFLHRVIDAVAFRVRNIRTHLYTGFVDFDYRTTARRLETAVAAVTS